MTAERKGAGASSPPASPPTASAEDIKDLFRRINLKVPSKTVIADLVSKIDNIATDYYIGTILSYDYRPGTIIRRAAEAADVLIKALPELQRARFRVVDIAVSRAAAISYRERHIQPLHALECALINARPLLQAPIARKPVTSDLFLPLLHAFESVNGTAKRVGMSHNAPAARFIAEAAKLCGGGTVTPSAVVQHFKRRRRPGT